MNSIGRAVWSRLTPDRRSLTIACIALAISTAATLSGPALVGYAVDHLHGASTSRELATLGAVCGAYLAAALTGAFFQRLQIRLVGTIGEAFLARLRVEVFEHLQRLPLAFYDSERTGRLVTRVTSDFDAMESLVQQGLIILVTNGLLFCAAVVVLLILSWQLFLVCLIVVPILYRASRRFQRDSRAAYMEVRDRVGQTLTTVQEGITGVRVVQAFGREEQQVRQFAERNVAQYQANIEAVRVSTRYFPVVEASSVVTTAGMVGIGGLFLVHHLVPLGTVVAFVLYLSSLFDPVQQMSQLFNQLQQSGAALRKVLGILEVTPTVREAADPVELPRGGELRVEGVGFAYGDLAAGAPTVLHDVDLRVRPGERLALVGPTGAGKSTLAKLMARMYDPVSGQVSYAGLDLRQASFASLRRRIVMVPQEGFLFRGSLLDNVRIGRAGASDEECREALRLIGAFERFAELPGVVASDGASGEAPDGGGLLLSAGERQLVALARAALAAPDVLVLDEATSSLDPGTEVAVERAMESLTTGRTTVVIAHRLTTAKGADRVAVIVDGGIAELGSHDELVTHGGRYAAMYAAWEAGGGAEPGTEWAVVGSGWE